MKIWNVELTARGEALAEVKIQRDIFQGVAFSALQFVIAMIPLIHIHGKCTGAYQFIKQQEKLITLSKWTISNGLKIKRRFGDSDTNNKNKKRRCMNVLKNVSCLKRNVEKEK